MPVYDIFSQLAVAVVASTNSLRFFSPEDLPEGVPLFTDDSEWEVSGLQIIDLNIMPRLKVKG